MAGPDTRIDLCYEYLHDRRTTDRGVPSDARGGAGTIDNPVEPLEGFDKTFFGDPDKSFAKADVHSPRLRSSISFTEGLTLRNRTLFGDYDKFYQNIYPNGAASTTAAGTVTLGAYNDTHRPPEPVQPDRPYLGKPLRRASTRPCCSALSSASRSRATAGRTASSLRRGRRAAR